jgi:hypothetical protein
MICTRITAKRGVSEKREAIATKFRFYGGVFGRRVFDRVYVNGFIF